MTTALDQHLEQAEFRRLYAEEGFVNEALERLADWMKDNEVSRAELARRLGTSRANVTQMLGGRNLSLRTLAAAIHVMGGRPRLEIDAEVKPAVQPRSSRPAWEIASTGWARPSGANSDESPYRYTQTSSHMKLVAGV